MLPNEWAISIFSTLVMIVCLSLGYYAGRKDGWDKGYDDVMAVWRKSEERSARLEVQEDDNEHADPRL